MRISKLIFVVGLLLSMLCTGCGVPDISDFTTASTEMTRAIRKGVKDTDSKLKSVRTQVPLDDTQAADFDKYYKTFGDQMRPTIKALDGVDAYLDALNGLIKAHNKSRENSEAFVGAVGSLVSTVSGFTIPGSATKFASGLIALYERARLERDFKKRVDLVAEIVEGRTIAKTDGEMTIYVSSCSDERILQITTSDKTPEQKAAGLRNLGCGIIDYLKINVQFLRSTNQDMAELLTTSLERKHEVLISYRTELQKNVGVIRRERSYILKYQNYVAEGKDESVLAPVLNYLLRLDDQFLSLKRDLAGFDKDCNAVKDCNDPVVRSKRRSLIIKALDSRDDQLDAFTRNRDTNIKQTQDDWDAAQGEMNGVLDKQKQLNDLLDSSLDALDTWKKTHINMRVSLNTNKPLSAAVLIARVKELWEIIQPLTKKQN